MADQNTLTDSSSQISPAAAESMTIGQLVEDYRDIHLMLNSQWPIESKNERVFARTMKLVEELGELANEILSKMGLQRQEKVDAFKQHHLEDEFADVLGSIMLMAVEMDIDVEAVMKKKIDFTVQRLQQEIETQL